ncbi:MAG: hypothetical protein H6816_05945 [Phycisphaerales bacterium]|nr:hypothetical protein [Phycisphaerales bacterium]
MWQILAILFGGYGFILSSYAWVWVIVAWMPRVGVAERMGRVGRADVKAVVGVSLAWTILWAVAVIAETGVWPAGAQEQYVMWWAMLLLGVACFGVLAAFVWFCDRV